METFHTDLFPLCIILRSKKCRPVGGNWTNDRRKLNKRQRKHETTRRTTHIIILPQQFLSLHLLLLEEELLFSKAFLNQSYLVFLVSCRPFGGNVTTHKTKQNWTTTHHPFQFIKTPRLLLEERRTSLSVCYFSKQKVVFLLARSSVLRSVRKGRTTLLSLND